MNLPDLPSFPASLMFVLMAFQKKKKCWYDHLTALLEKRSLRAVICCLRIKGIVCFTSTSCTLLFGRNRSGHNKCK